MRSALFVPFLVVALLASGTVASAAPQWCEDDPVFLLNGGVVDITTAFEAQYIDDISEVSFVVEVPWNTFATAVLVVPAAVPTTASVTRTLPAWSGVGGMPVVAHVRVKAKGNFETRTRVTKLGTTLVSTTPGRSNSTQTLSFQVVAAGT